MKRSFLFIILLGIVLTSTANTICLNVKGTVKSERIAVSNATIKIIKNGVAEKTTSTNEKGKFNFELEKNKQYKIVIKKDGFFSPSVIINTNIDDSEDYCWNYKFIIDLIPTLNLDDSKVFDKPIGHIAYNENSDNFENEVNSNIIAKYKEFLARYESIKESKYDELISMADSALINRDCEVAYDLYNKATAINEYNNYADLQVEMLRNFKLKYQKTIERADNYFSNKEFKKAKQMYLRALEIKQQEYPMAQLNKIEKLITEENVLAVQ